MTPLKKKLLMYGGGAFLGAIALYLIFKKKEQPNVLTDAIETDNNNSNNTNYSDLPVMVYTKSGTRLRKEPSTSSEILTTFKIGQPLTPVDSKKQTDGLWYQVLEQGGWVRSDVVTTK